MKRKSPIILLLTACLWLVSCSKADQETAAGTYEICFRVMNVTQENLNDDTRTSGPDVLAHLSLGIFDAATGKAVGTVQTQNRGEKDYGTFRLQLATGQYRLVFLGYDGSRALRMTSPAAVSFEQDYVPHTFLYQTLLTVDENLPPQQSVTLRRAVGAVRLLCEDAWPQGLGTFRIQTTGGSTRLNALTGFAADAAGRTAEVEVPESTWGGKNNYVTFYLFLPDGGTTADVTITALDTEGETLQQRTFSNVAMEINKITIFKGSFFSIGSQAQVDVDYEWGQEEEVPF